MNPYQNHTDTELVQLLSEGDELAFNTLYKRYVQGLLRFANKSIFNKEDCEEIVQETFVELWAGREQFGQVTNVTAYLFSIIRYKIVHYIRFHMARQKYAAHYHLFAQVYNTSSSEQDNADRVGSFLDNALQGLPNRCQTAFRLRLSEDLSYKEIAERMEISVKTVEKYISAALGHLRKAYKEAVK